jgi:predicted metalloendopeptidase
MFSGAMFDGRGDRRQWLTKETMRALESRLECVSQQYSTSFERQVTFLGSSVDVQVSSLIYASFKVREI